MSGTSPSPGNNHTLHIALSKEKRIKWSAILGNRLKLGEIPHICLGELIGVFSFSQTCIFRKFARAQMRPLRQKFDRRAYNAKLSPRERDTFAR